MAIVNELIWGTSQSHLNQMLFENEDYLEGCNFLTTDVSTLGNSLAHSLLLLWGCITSYREIC